jgi:hypothetical protein
MARLPPALPVSRLSFSTTRLRLAGAAGALRFILAWRSIFAGKPPSRITTSSSATARRCRRHDELEAQRACLIARLATFREVSRRHPAYRRAGAMPNETFRKEKLAQRLAVLLQAAA